MSKFDISGKNGMTPEELGAQLALEAQLRSTAEMIQQMLTEHPHFTDDCGEYLRSMLELSARLQHARENGPEDLILEFKELAKTPEGGEKGHDTELTMLYPEYHEDVETIVNKYNEVEE